MTALKGTSQDEFGVAEISAETPNNLGYVCKHAPLSNNNAHALIVGDTKPIAKKLSKAITNVFNFSDDKEENKTWFCKIADKCILLIIIY